MDNFKPVSENLKLAFQNLLDDLVETCEPSDINTTKKVTPP